MDPITNPFAPGAGTPPPELAGREELRETVRIAIERMRRGLPTKSILMVGLRGVGKTVLLDRMDFDAEASGIYTLRIEAPENRSLPAVLAPQLRQALLKLSRNEKARALAQRALRALTGFAKSLKVQYQDIEVGFDFEAEPGLADNGDLEQDLQTLLESSGNAAQEAGSGLAIFIDELQYVNENELAIFITALHRCAQRRLPIILVGAGLPQLRGKMGQAKSYSERLFDFPELGPLTSDATKLAIEKPAKVLQVDITNEALDLLVEKTKGYPYFVQEWGKHAWDVALTSPITKKDIEIATITAIAALDESFFRVRFDRLTPAEKLYLHAMAKIGAGPHRSGDVAAQLQREVTALGPTRNQLITKGMIWSPSHGETAFTVPMFNDFMLRIMPM